ncbi:hypothetical protein FOS14_05750 [Skermania sp. ID1734]|uniref:hypothetical protein n=1 Tax=Skermania sp. ID1734 TaxID=2597516 RepID=UPI00117CB256|nr:hypothetical protein [Skermania sp. ID1734]TSE01230.1 hypothetical protein FOS14_05750 [Skermania sp. ID1734]
MSRHMRGYVGAALLALLLMLLPVLGGCGSHNSAPALSSQPPTSTIDPHHPPIPTPAELNAMLQHALDPNVPAQEKAQFLQGGERDPGLFTRAGEAMRKYNATITIVSVTDTGNGTLNAGADFTLNGQPNHAEIPFVWDDGRWKVQNKWACGLIINVAQSHSPACT